MQLEITKDMLLSVIIPCYNEVQHIEACITSLLQQEFPFGNFEIIVVDGMSTDGTRDHLQKFCTQNNNIIIVDNKKKHTPFAMNLGIRSASGDFISILGAHSVYDKKYLSNCYELFVKHPEADCTGGPVISDGKTAFGKAAALAMSHPLGVGNAKHRFPDYEGYAEGACFPMFRREVFDKIGFYDEKLIRNQDDELNFRLTKQGGKVYISPEASCVYYVRDSIKSLFRQYFQYGFWRVAVIRKHKEPIALRQVVPVIFVPVFIVSLFLLLLPSLTGFAGLIVPGLYLGSLFFASVFLAIKKPLKPALLFPFAVMILHFSYGIGFAVGVFSGRTRL